MENVLITGANRGIGLGLAKEFSRAGWNVLAGARQPSAASALQAASRAASPGTITMLGLDVTDEKSVRAAAADAARVSTLDVLVNNAAVFPEEGNERLEELPLEFFARAFEVNVTAVARVTRAFLPHLGRADHPRVVNISSRAGLISEKQDARFFCYSASKAALNMLTRAMAADLQPRGITVVAVTPGWVRTAMGGPSAPLTVEESACSLRAMIGRITKEDAGRFLDRDGHPIDTAW